MRRLSAAIALSVLLPASVQAWTHSGGRPACSVYTTFSSTDGCAGAPAYLNSTLSYRDAAAFTDGTFWSVTSRLSNFQWNVAGVDFAVGVTPGSYCGGALACSTTPGATNLWSPVGYNFATDPAGTGCDPSLSAIMTDSGMNVIKCYITAGHTAINFNGVDLNPGNTDCYNLYVRETTGSLGLTGTINFTNSRMHIDSSKASCLNTLSSSTVTGQSPVTLGNYPGGMSDVFAITVNNNVLYQDGQNPLQLLANATTLPMYHGAVSFSTGGTFTAHYNYIPDTHNYVFYGSACNGIDYSYNVEPHVSPYVAYGHGDFTLQNGFSVCPSTTVPYITETNNTIWNNPSTQTIYGAITTFLTQNAIGASGTPTTITNTTVTLNTLIVNPQPNYTVNSPPTIVGPGSGYTIDDQVSIHDPNCDPANGGGRRWPVVRVQTVSSGALLTVQLADGGACNPAPATGVTLATTDAPGYAGGGGTGSGATISIPGGAYITYLAGDGGSYASDGANQQQFFTNITIANNATVTTGGGSPSPGFMAQGTHYGVKCTNPISTSGNFDAISGAILAQGSGLNFPTTDVGGTTGC